MKLKEEMVTCGFQKVNARLDMEKPVIDEKEEKKMMIETGITSEGDWNIGDVIVNNNKNCIALIVKDNDGMYCAMDIDALVEGVYRDQMDRKNFHSKFVKFGLALFFLILAVQYMYGTERYIELLDIWYVRIILHAIIIVNALFLLKGEKYYNEDVGVE